MRIAVMSDIHGNLPALEAVYEDLKARGADQVVVLGDLSLKGPYPKACLERIEAIRPTAIIQGNTDQWLVEGLPAAMDTTSGQGRKTADLLTWTRERLGGRLDALRGLPFSHETRLGEEGVLFLHSTPASNTDWVPLSSPDETLEAHFHHPRANVFVTGHVHVPGLRRLSDRRLVVNAGSVGMPWDGDWRASYAILEGDGQRIAVNLIRVPYDIERTIEAARSVEMPWAEEYANALRRGIPF